MWFWDFSSSTSETLLQRNKVCNVSCWYLLCLTFFYFLIFLTSCSEAIYLKKLGSRPVVRRDTCKYYLIQACSFLPWMVVRCQSDTFFFLFSYKSSTYDCNIHRTSHMFHVCKPNIMIETRAQLKRSAVVIWEHLTWIYCSDRSVCHRADIKYILVLILF